MPITPIEFLFVPVTSYCNLLCVHCHIWTLGIQELSLKKRCDFISYSGEVSPNTELYLTGGEPFSRPKDLLTLINAARNADLTVATGTNGTLVTETLAKKLVCDGLLNIVISLDSHKAEIHDSLRSVPGTFNRVIKAIQDFRNARKSLNPCFQIFISSILGSWNLPMIDKLVDYCQYELLVDGIMFQPLQPSFGARSDRKELINNPLFPTPSQVEIGIEILKSFKNRYSFIKETQEQLEAFKQYFYSSQFLERSVCDSCEKNLMIDFEGNVTLCFNAWEAGFKPIGNIKKDSPEIIFEKRNDHELLDKMRKCRRSCGLMLCHRKNSFSEN